MKPENDSSKSDSGGGLSGCDCSHIPFSAEWYRARAEQVRHNGKNVSQYNHFLGIAEAKEILERENAQLRLQLDHYHSCADILEDMQAAINEFAEEYQNVKCWHDAPRIKRLFDLANVRDHRSPRTAGTGDAGATNKASEE